MSLFWYALLCVLSSFAVILKRKRELVAMLYIFLGISCYCKCSWALFLTVSWVGLQCVIVVFPDHTRLLSDKIRSKLFYTEYLLVLLKDFLCPRHLLWGGAYSITLVRTSVLPYVRNSVHPVCTKNGFRTISFENIGVLDSYFIHRYIIIKYRLSLITDKIKRLLSE